MANYGVKPALPVKLILYRRRLPRVSTQIAGKTAVSRRSRRKEYANIEKFGLTNRSFSHMIDW